MGRYINETSKIILNASANDKAMGILDDGAIEIPKPKIF
jgi:hypothetical protein